MHGCALSGSGTCVGVGVHVCGCVCTCVGCVHVCLLLHAVLCMLVQVLDPELDLRTVKHSIWKGGGDLKLSYRLKDEHTLHDKPANPTVPSSDQRATDTCSANEGKSDQQQHGELPVQRSSPRQQGESSAPIPSSPVLKSSPAQENIEMLSIPSATDPDVV